jgi:hypothetical protein
MDPMIIVAGISATASVVVTLIAGLMQRRMKEVHHQVKNNHSTNLRQDIDWLMDGIKQLITTENRHDRELIAVREDVSAIQRMLIERSNHASSVAG